MLGAALGCAAAAHPPAARVTRAPCQGLLGTGLGYAPTARPQRASHLLSCMCVRSRGRLTRRCREGVKRQSLLHCEEAHRFAGPTHACHAQGEKKEQVTMAHHLVLARDACTVAYMMSAQA
jgi:hypothetical protein